MQIGANAISKLYIGSNAVDKAYLGANLVYSSNTWDEYTSGGAGGKAIAYGAGLFVAIGKNNSEIWTSSDGISWTSRTNPSSSEFVDIAFHNGLFVAVSRSANTDIITSTDGISWTLRTASNALGKGAVSYNEARSKWVAFVEAGTGAFGYHSESADGITWADAGVTLNTDYYGACQGRIGGTDYVYGFGRQDDYPTVGKPSMLRYNNLFQTLSFIDLIEEDEFFGGAQVNNRIVLVGSGAGTGGNGLIYSDGASSSNNFVAGTPVGNGNWKDVEGNHVDPESNTKVVAVGGGSVKIASSTDGSVWTEEHTSSVAFEGVAYGGGKWVACGISTPAFAVKSE